ncbi:MAG TPA: dTDP-4-dehydrorhamnose reductase [Candidatus Acidoferrales bacterium]|nr:dTDP-4-dehydrorhamnose reductase [Candidatus Acidoferrales bacterium]
MPSSKRIAVIGSTGQLGSDIMQILTASDRYEVTPLPHDRLDITNRKSVTDALGRKQFDVVVNCAAFHRVDECEDRPEEALRVNALGAFEVGRACRESNSQCVFVSTDYVFGGDKGSPYTEEDAPDPINVYGISKVAGELFVQEAASRWLILRVASLYGMAGARGKGGNFVETILAKARAGDPIKVVNDVWMSPTYTRDVAAALDVLIQLGVTGVCHATNSGYCTWFEFAREALRLTGFEHRIEPITSDAYLSKARRPRNSSLEGLRLRATLGHTLRPWREALQAYLAEKGHLISSFAG